MYYIVYTHRSCHWSHHDARQVLCVTCKVWQRYKLILKRERQSSLKIIHLLEVIFNTVIIVICPMFWALKDTCYA